MAVFGAIDMISGVSLIDATSILTKAIFDNKFPSTDIILFGRESAGVPEYVHDTVNERLTIPMIDGPRSINLSSSVAIVAGEMLRQLKLG